jgi:hypothetical protein
MKINFGSNTSTVFILLISMHLTFGLFAQKLDCYVIKTPVKKLDQVKKIGVLDFSGHHKAKSLLTDFIIADLLNESRGIQDLKSGFLGMGKKIDGVSYVKGYKTDVYVVVERSQIDRILKEQRFGLSGAIDESTAAKVGKLLGLDVILIGEVDYDRKDEYPETTTIGLDGKTKKVNCHQRTVTAQASLKIIDVETAIIVGTETSRVPMSDKKCGDEKSSIASEELLLNTSLQLIARNLVDYFTPGYECIRFEFEKIKLKDIRKQADEASNHISNGNIDRALPLFYAIYQADSYNPKAAYNLAALYEIVGSYNEALEFYTIASNLDPSNQVYAAALNRSREGLATLAFLERIGRPIQQFEFSSSTDVLMAKRIKINGKSSDRVDVRDLPAKNGKVIGKVPGGLEFPMLEQKGEWYRIQLPDGKEGFVHKSDIK